MSKLIRHRKIVGVIVTDRMEDPAKPSTLKKVSATALMRAPGEIRKHRADFSQSPGRDKRVRWIKPDTFTKTVLGIRTRIPIRYPR